MPAWAARLWCTRRPATALTEPHPSPPNPQPSSCAPPRQPCARLIQHHGDDNRAADDDPFVVLIEMQRPDRLTDENDQQRAQQRTDRAALSTRQAGAADDGRRDDVQLISG